MSWAGVSNEKRYSLTIMGKVKRESGLDDLVKKNLRLSGQRIDINALRNRCAGNTIFPWASFVPAVADGLSLRLAVRYPGLR